MADPREKQIARLRERARKLEEKAKAIRREAMDIWKALRVDQEKAEAVAHMAEFRATRERKKAQQQTVKDALASGKTQAQIARDLGLSSTRIGNIIYETRKAEERAGKKV